MFGNQSLTPSFRRAEVPLDGPDAAVPEVEVHRLGEAVGVEVHQVPVRAFLWLAEDALDVLSRRAHVQSEWQAPARRTDLDTPEASRLEHVDHEPRIGEASRDAEGGGIPIARDRAPLHRGGRTERPLHVG